MTRFVGFFIKASPCCGQKYRTKRYASMNFMAAEYWTDGYRERSLMPNDHGLRKCTCGRYFLLKEMDLVDEVDESDLAYPSHVEPLELPRLLALPHDSEIELVARIDYWQHLNHPYRENYRRHRLAEDKATQEAWERAHPDQRSLLHRLQKLPRTPRYKPSADRPITFPNFVPTEEQKKNMNALVDLLDRKSPQSQHLDILAELHRELGRFEEAKHTLKFITRDDDDPIRPILEKLISNRTNAPARYAP